MTLEQAIDTALKADAQLSALVGSNIFWLQATQGITAPYLVYQIIADTDQPLAFGKTNTGTARLQIDVVSSAKSGKAAIYRVREILRGKNGTIGGLAIDAILPMQIRERFNEQTMRYVFSIDFDISFAY